MHKHGSINRAFRLVRNESLDCWVPAAETSRGRGKSSGRPAGLLALLLALFGVQVQGQEVAIAPPAHELPNGGNVVAGSAILTHPAGTAVLNIDQGTQRAIIDWNTFNVGSAAQVNFNQPGRDSSTLNRVLDSNPSRIFGSITSTGQVFLTNPNGVYFGKTATVDVGSLAATTHGIDNADFLAGSITLNRNGATGSVVNEGELRAALGGYIALLAPEVRNSGVIVASLGTVALASGESFTLNFDGNHLAGITVTPSAIAALVENKGAVLAPGGLIILSAKALDRLQGGVVNNSGTLEATGLSMKGGRIVLEASDTIDNSGSINVDAGADGSPAGSVELTAPEIINSGTITASAVLAPLSGGSIVLTADNITQMPSGSLDVSGVNGGSITLDATHDIVVAGEIAAIAADGQGGSIAIAADHDVTLQGAVIDASGGTHGGQIMLAAGGAPAPSAPLGELPTLALFGGTQLRSASRRGRGGSVKLTGGRVGLFDQASIDATGATGGGDVLVGGGFHGQDPSIANAQQVTVGTHATIDASATHTGAGGNVAVWSDGQTTYAGNIAARGGSDSGDGGFVEVSGKENLAFVGMVYASAAHGAAGSLLLDPKNIIVDAAGLAAVGDVNDFSDTPAADITIAPNTITAITNGGTSVNLLANNDITVNSSIVTNNPLGAGGDLTFIAGRSIILNGSVNSDDGNILFAVNYSGADGNRVPNTDAVFINNSLIDAGDGQLSIVMGTKEHSGVISTGQVTAGTFNISQTSSWGDAASGAIDLGEITVTGNMSINASSARNVTNTLGSVIVRGTATIAVGAGDVTINRATTDFNFIGLTAHNATLADTNAMRFTATNLSGNLIESARGPIAQTGAVAVGGTTSLTVTNGGFGYADPYINLSNAGNDFGGAVTISAASTGETGTGGYVAISDANALSIATANIARALTMNTGAGFTTGSMNIGTTLNAVSSGPGAMTLGTTGITTVVGSANVSGDGLFTLQGTTTVGNGMNITSTTGAVVLEGPTAITGHLNIYAGDAVDLQNTTSVSGNLGITSGDAVTLQGTTTVNHTLVINAQGAVDLATVTVNDDMTVNTDGAITDSGVLTVGNFTYLTAGAANDITLDTLTNNFNYLQIVSGDDVTLVDGSYIIIGPWGGSTISGNLSITAGGSILQYSSHDNTSPIVVGGTATFITTAADSDLYLGPVQQNYIEGWRGAQNSFADTVTISTTGAGAWRDVSIKNIDSDAGVISGLGAGLRDVLFLFDHASSISLPAMTLSGNLVVDIPNGGITQTGALVVDNANNAYVGISIFNASAGADVVLTHAGNDFNHVTVSSAQDASFVDVDAIDLYSSNAYFNLQRNLTVTAAGAITDSSRDNNVGYWMYVGSSGAGVTTLTAGSANDIVLDNDINIWQTVVINSANNVVLHPRNSLLLGDVHASGTAYFDSRDGGSLTQLASTEIHTGSDTALYDFTSGITLTEAGNVLGGLGIYNPGFVDIHENDAITQAWTWIAVSDRAITLTTSNDQAITLTAANNAFGNLTLTQITNGATSAGAVTIDEDNDHDYGMTQGGAWTLHGATALDTGAYSVTLMNPLNVLGPLQVTGAMGNTGGVPSTVTIYARNSTAGDAIRDGAGAWNTGTGEVKLIAYNAAGAVAGGGNINLANAGNVLGDLYIKATNARITENDDITDGASTIWNSAGNTGWLTTGTTNLVVANASGRSITLDNLTNVIGPLGLNMTGTAGTLSSVLITDNSNLTQASVWNVGAAPVTVDARNHAITLNSSGNVLGAITINTTNGMPTSIAITENDAITQGAPWIMSGVPVTLVAENNNAITLDDEFNVLGNLTLTGGVVSVRENDAIQQGGAWTTTGSTTLDATANAITLTNAGNVLGALAFNGAPTSVSITENDHITQASAWIQPGTLFTLNAGATHDIVLSQSANQLGDLKLTARDATVTEDDVDGISDGGAWNINRNLVLTAGAANAIVLNANPASDFGTVSIVSASNADITDVNGIILGSSTIAAGGTLNVTAGGAITQTGAIIAPSLRLAGAGSATLANTSNSISTLAVARTGGDLAFTNAGTFAIGTVSGTAGINVGFNDVTLTSVAGTVTGLASVEDNSTSLTVSVGGALVLPQMNIGGAQTYTATGGITLNSDVRSTVAGAINFASAVTLDADLTVRSENSAINFASTVAGGTNILTVNAGTVAGTVAFLGAVSNLGDSNDANPALQLTSSGASFASTLSANNGLGITGPVVFNDTVTLAEGNAASVFTGLVTLGRAGGMDLSGYNGMSFNGGVLLQNGAATINSNDSQLAFRNNMVTGPYALTLNSGTSSLIGLNLMGPSLTGLSVTAFSPTIPLLGVTIAGPQSYTATAGSVITLSGNVSSTAAGTIIFNSPVTLGASAIVSSTDSDVLFAGTVNGSQDLTVSAGTGTTTFTGAVGALAALGDGTGAALTVTGTGATTFGSTLQTQSGITTGGSANFNNNVTLGDGNVGSSFAGVTLSGGITGNSISGFDGLAFNGGLAVSGGPVSIASNGSTLHLGGPVSGPQILTLNALAGGAGTITGLGQIGLASNLTGLNLTAATLNLPGTGMAIAGPMNFTAAGGITLNGAVGSSSTLAINFNGPMTLASGAIVVMNASRAVNFNGTMDGAQDLVVNTGPGLTTFGGAVGGSTALTSVLIESGGLTAINGGSIRTTGAQTYTDNVQLGADTTLTGVGLNFYGTLNGARALIVNDSGETFFGNRVGGVTALTSITTDAPGTVAMNGLAVYTTAAQTWNEHITLGTDTVFSGIGLTFAGIDGAQALDVNAGSGTARFNGALGATTPLASVAVTANAIALGWATTSGSQTYTAPAGVSLNGELKTTNNNVTITGPTTLAGNTVIATSGGTATLSGATSTLNGPHTLVVTAGAGDVVLGGVVGGVTRLAGIHLSGNNLTLPGIATVGDLNQTYTALNNITLNQSRNVNAPISFTADSDSSGAGSFILLDGVSLTASNNTLSIQAADLDLQGNSTMSSGSGLMSITASNGRNLALGGADAAGQLTISGDELARMSSSSGLNLNTTAAGWVHVNGITALQSQNITGTLRLNALGTGEISFITAPSTFNALRVAATGGAINVGVNLTTTNDAIQFVTPVSVSGASTIASDGGNISFASTLAVDNDLTLSTGNGTLTFGGAVGSNKTLTLNLGGGSVIGLAQLQSALTGLTVNGTSGITLPALAIAGPQIYNTGTITVTGSLAGTGITFNNLVDVAPASGAALTLNAGTGTLDFTNLVSFNNRNMTLIGDEINFARAVTGSGSLGLRAFTGSLDTQVGGSGSPIAGLNLTAAELAWLPIGTFASLTIGNAAGTGSLELAGTLNAPGTPVTLNGGGGITQSGGSLTSGSLSLYAAGAAIALNSATNAFGAVGITGAPTSLNLRNTLAINQLGAAAWVLGGGPVTLNAGTHDITLGNAGNTFGTLTLNGGNVHITEAAATVLGVSSIANNLTVDSSGAIDINGALTATGNVSLTAGGLVAQSAPLTIGGSLSVLTTVPAGNVTIDNSGAAVTSLGNTFIGGDFVLTATGRTVTQSAGTSLQVLGDLTITADDISLGGAANLIGGNINLPNTSSVEIRASGVIALADQTYAGNLTVISERSTRTFGAAVAVGGDAIVLDNAANNIGGSISISASPTPITTTGLDAVTGISQDAGTSIRVAGVASFTAEGSAAGSEGIVLTNAGNSFGTLQLSGTTVNVANAATTLTTIDSAVATDSLTLTTAGGVAQTGAISAPILAINAAGTVALGNVGNDVNSLSVISGGNAISYVDANGVSVTALNAGGANVSLTAGGIGNLTQTGALLNVAALSANAGGAVTLNHAGNTIGSLGASLAGSGFQLNDSAGGLGVTGIVRTLSSDMLLRTSGDLSLAGGSQLRGDAGNVVVSTEGAGNFINSAGSAAIVAGTGKHWLVYSNTPDLAAGAHTVKNGLASSFRHYGATYGTYAPGSVTESGNGYIYRDAAPTLSVRAAISGTPSHIYGDTPTGSLGYTISAGLLDSEDNASNVITGGTATYSSALSNAMNAGGYSIGYTGGLTSSHTLIADPTGAAYTVTPALLTYTAGTASRIYGAVNPSLSGTVGGFKLGQDVSVLGGSASWTTTALTGSNVGQYLIGGSGYSASNYTFAQAAGNATAFSITTAGLTVTANGDSRTYNGTTYSGGAGVTYSAFANGEGAGVLGGTLIYGGDSQVARNAGSYTIAASGLTSGNYSINYVNGTLAIGRANVSLTPNAVTRTYDGTLAATGSATVTGGTQLFGTDSMSGGTFAFTDANAGSGNRTVTLNGVNLNDGNGGANYNVSYLSNTASTINRASITVASTNVARTYDGTLSANGGATLAAGSLFDNVSNGNLHDFLSGGSFAFTDANAGAGNKAVTTSGVTVNDGNSGGNYNVTYANNTTSTINAAPLAFLGTIARRDYDGTTAATLSGYTLSGFIGSETVTATAGTAAFLDRNADTGKTVNLTGISLGNGTNGGLASNYSVAPTASALGTIDPKLLTLNATVADRTYDGTTNALVQSYGLSGFVGSETVSGVFTGSARFADKHVGTDKGITITGIVLVNGANGGLASNYLAPTAAVSTADITSATLQVAGVVALDKVYDGTMVAFLDTGSSGVTGVFGSDDVSIGSITGTFLTKDVGVEKSIGAGTVVLSGADAGDYTLVQPTGLTATISQRALVVSATGINRVYNGTTGATTTLTDNRIAGDGLAVTGLSSFLDKNAGVGKFVNVSGIAISGADAGNYTVNGSASTSATITRANLVVTADSSDKVYDGNTGAIVTLSGTPLAGDSVALSFTSAAFDDKNAGSGKGVSVAGIRASGTDAGNYSVNATTATTADITPALLTVLAVGHSKPFDDNTVADVTLSDDRIAGDDLAFVTAGATFADAEIGSDKPITVSGIQISGGADSGNYMMMSDGATTAADITGPILAGTASTWALAPVLPKPLPPVSLTAPEQLLDFTLPVSFGGGSRTAEAMGNSISVTVVRAALPGHAGMVSVVIPEDVFWSGMAFSFPLPAAVAEAAGARDVRVTLRNGRALPSWLRYVPINKSFVAYGTPVDALPVEVVVQVGEQSWIVTITKPKSH